MNGSELEQLQQNSSIPQAKIEALLGSYQLQVLQQMNYIEILEARIKELQTEVPPPPPKQDKK